MRKKYIFWWVISALFFWNAVARFVARVDLNIACIFLLIAGVLFYVGYLRAKEYEQQKEDRAALHRMVALAAEEKSWQKNNEYDDTLEGCVDLALDNQSLSISLIQRTMRVGYTQAARWMDELERLGVVGPYQGKNPRDVLYTKENWPGLEKLRELHPTEKENINSQLKCLTYDVVGETFRNEDGSARQKILKEAYNNDCSGVASLECYDYKGSPAIHVLYNGEIVGNIGANDVNEVLGILARMAFGTLFVDRFVPTDKNRREDDRQSFVGKNIYYARITIYCR